MRRSPFPKPGISVVARRAAGRIVAIAVSGHAGTAPRGRDIVCAATSALVLSAAHGIVAHCKSRADVIDDGDGDYRLEVPRGGNGRAQAVLESTLSGLRAIARSYPRALRVRVAAGTGRRLAKRARPT